MPEIPTFPPRPSRIPIILGVIVFGITSGALGTALLFWLFPGFRQAQIPPGSQAVIVQQPGRVVVEEGIHIQDIRDSVRPSIVSIYRTKDVVKIDGATTYFPPNRVSAYGVLLTNDGWFGTTAAADLKVGDIVVIADKPVAVEKIVVDPASDFVLGKLTAPFSLPVVTFLADSSVKTGMTIVGVSAQENAYRTTLWSKQQPNDPQIASLSSDSLDTAYHLVDVAGFPPGTPFFDLSGSLLGLVSKTQNNQPLLASGVGLNSLLNRLLFRGGPMRPFFGIRYVPMADPASSGEGGWRALIYSEDAAQAVKAKSPAALAGLKAGDQITKIGENNLSRLYPTVFSALQLYYPGEKVAVEYVRNGRTNTAVVTIGSEKKEVAK